MHRPLTDGEAPSAMASVSRVEFVGGPRDGQSEDRGDLPDRLDDAAGSYRRSVRCAEDGAMRYVWIDIEADRRT